MQADVRFEATGAPRCRAAWLHYHRPAQRWHHSEMLDKAVSGTPGYTLTLVFSGCTSGSPAGRRSAERNPELVR